MRRWTPWTACIIKVRTPLNSHQLSTPQVLLQTAPNSNPQSHQTTYPCFKLFTNSSDHFTSTNLNAFTNSSESNNIYRPIRHLFQLIEKFIYSNSYNCCANLSATHLTSLSILFSQLTFLLSLSFKAKPSRSAACFDAAYGSNLKCIEDIIWMFTYLLLVILTPNIMYSTLILILLSFKKLYWGSHPWQFHDVWQLTYRCNE